MKHLKRLVIGFLTLMFGFGVVAVGVLLLMGLIWLANHEMVILVVVITGLIVMGLSYLCGYVHQ